MPLRIPARRSAPVDIGALRSAADQAFSRTAGAPLVGGNAVRVLRDATENYPAWEAAIDAATTSIHIEMYIVHRDRTGRRFVELLARKARAGVPVRVIYDWFGCGLGPMLGLFRPLIAAGGEARPFNPPRLSSALGWLRRNHRKLITIDGRVAFVSGLCIGHMWEGDTEKDANPGATRASRSRGRPSRMPKPRSPRAGSSSAVLRFPNRPTPPRFRPPATSRFA